MSSPALDRRCSVAPMVNWTHRHQRFFMRIITSDALLYTEMVTTGAVLRGDAAGILQHDPAEHPVALQLGGNDPKQLAICARIGQDMGYAEINLNLGCPSERVQNGAFGACLMAEPGLVADCYSAMQDAVNIPVTVKHRTGVDNLDAYELLVAFVATIANAGCSTFIVHARKAILTGLSPRQNRQVPPLKIDWVYALKREFPQLEIILNGGITDLSQAVAHLQKVDGVMLGRAAYHDPFMMADVGRQIFNRSYATPSRAAVFQAYADYVSEEIGNGTPLNRLMGPTLGLFSGMKGAKAWRRFLSENMHQKGRERETVRAAELLALEINSGEEHLNAQYVAH